MTIKELRQLTGMSQSQFADHFEIPVRTIQEWEQGKRMPAEYLIRLLEGAVMMNNLGAIEKLYKRLNSSDVLDDIASDRLTENTAKNGRNVLWYVNDSEEEAIYTDTLEFLSTEEIEEQLA